MSLIAQYLRRSQEIIGHRTDAEEQYDTEVIKWLKKGLTIKRAVKKANQKYPDEALKINEINIDDVAAHYDYLRQHLEIMEGIDAKQGKM